MHRKFFFLLLFSILFGCKDSSIQSHFTQENIVIDGKLDEWDKYPLQHFEDEHFSVSFLNNSNDLFLILATRDRQLMRIVQTSGIDIWLDVDKKKSKEYGLHYIGDIDTLDFSQTDKKMPRQNQDQPPKMQKQQSGTILFYSFGNEYLLNKSLETDPKASVDMYKSVYLLEVRIPFSDKDLFANIKEGKLKKINVGFAMGKDMSEMKRGSRPSGGKGGMGGGRGGAGGRGGGMGGSPPDGRPQPIGKIEKWFTVTLKNKK